MTEPIDNSADTANEGLDGEVIFNEPEEGSTAPDGGTQPTDSQPDNAELSRIGRIVKKQLEREYAPLMDELATLKATIAQMTPREQKKANIPPPPVDGFPTTPEEFLEMDKWARQVNDSTMQAEASEARGIYERAYIASLNKCRDEGGDLHAQIQDLLTKDGSPYNITHGTGRGDIDAMLNYRAARADILANKVKGGSNPFKGKTNDVATGLSASTRVPDSKTLKVKFSDPKAEELANFLKIPDDERARIISGK